MENPYAHLRRLTGTSQKDFAEKYSLAKTTMTYIESGQYPDLSDRMEQAIFQECEEKAIDVVEELRANYGTYSLSEAYHIWQKNERVEAAHLFQQSPPIQATPKLSPFHFFIKQTTGSAQSFCKTLKVPAATVLRYTTGATKNMPGSIESALRDVQFPYLEELRKMQGDWAAANG